MFKELPLRYWISTSGTSVVVVRTRPRAIPLVIITMGNFLFFWCSVWGQFGSTELPANNTDYQSSIANLRLLISCNYAIVCCYNKRVSRFSKWKASALNISLTDRFASFR